MHEKSTVTSGRPKDDDSPTLYVSGGQGVAIPTIGAFLQLGFNDDLFFDNTGSQHVCVGSSSAAVEAYAAGVVGVPAPGTLVLISAGLLGLSVLHRRRTTVA